LPWLGVSAECPREAEAEELLKSMGYTPRRKIQLEVLVEGSWTRFSVFEVHGFVEGVAGVLAEELGCPALESGPHLVLGEVSAKIWDEAAKVVFPDGREVLIPILTYDAFLDVVLPTSKVRGLEGRITILGKTYRLPLSKEDLAEIARLGEKYLEKVERAAAAYGLSRILSEAALEALKPARKAEEEISYEVDFEEKVAVVRRGGKLTVVTIPRLVLMLAETERFDEAEEILRKCGGEVLEEVREMLLELYSYYSREDEKRSRLKGFLEKLGFLKEGEET
jgi:cell division protein ZapA (FtsZ GTPase activity inhibitor)